jgi:hypothetical protein
LFFDDLPEKVIKINLLLNNHRSKFPTARGRTQKERVFC